MPEVKEKDKGLELIERVVVAFEKWVDKIGNGHSTDAPPGFYKDGVWTMPEKAKVAEAKAAEKAAAKTADKPAGKAATKTEAKVEAKPEPPAEELTLEADDDMMSELFGGTEAEEELTLEGVKDFIAEMYEKVSDKAAFQKSFVKELKALGSTHISKLEPAKYTELVQRIRAIVPDA